ncbi:hypothetical protein E9993_14710 [Labilibacter sediminis]|nr:hypothetical protein E9993_14710 [Labilibacter sediminis]
MKTFQLILYYLLFLISASSCNECGDLWFIKCEPDPEPEIKGCTDLAAINYNVNATTDDGSCIYCDESKIYKEVSEQISINAFYNSKLTAVFKFIEIAYKSNIEGCQGGGCDIVLLVTNYSDYTISFAFNVDHYDPWPDNWNYQGYIHKLVSGERSDTIFIKKGCTNLQYATTQVSTTTPVFE